MCTVEIPLRQWRFNNGKVALRIKSGMDAFEYDNASEIGHGAFAHVISAKMKDTDIAASEIVAVKFLQFNTIKSEQNASFINEVRALKAIQKGDVKRLSCTGNLDVEYVDGEEQVLAAYNTPFFATPFFGKQTMGDLIANQIDGADHRLVISLASTLLGELADCHDCNVLHLDLHEENIVCRVSCDASENYPYIDVARFIDFGNSVDRGFLSMYPRRVAKFKKEAGSLSRSSIHPKLKEYYQNGEAPASAFLDDNAFCFDYYAVADCLLNFIAKYMRRGDRDFQTNLIAIQEFCQKLQNAKGRINIREMAKKCTSWLESSYRRPESIRLPGQLTVLIPKKTALSIVDTAEVQRLRNVCQLNLTHLVYPGATHTRFSHTLGVYHYCGKYIEALSRNSAFFRSEISDEEISLLKTKALLHDVGHFPFAHYFEELEKQGYKSHLEIDHEKIGMGIISGSLKMRNSSLESLNQRLKDIHGRDFQEGLEQIADSRVLRQIIDGPIDCDKLDYLRRDGLSCGVPYADSIDVQRLLESLEVVYPAATFSLKRANLGITAKGIAPVESMLNARFHLYSEVYWHKTCRMFSAMIKKAFILLDEHEEKLNADQWYDAIFCLNDFDFLGWLCNELDKRNMQREASDLIKNPLIMGDRSKFYGRIATFSANWRAEGNLVINRIGKHVKSIEQVKKFETALLKEIEEITPGKEIPPHWLIIDSYAAHMLSSEGEEEILVSYDTNSGRLEPIEIGEISGLFKNRSGSVSPFVATRKFRIFAHREVANLMKKKFGTQLEMQRWVSKVVNEYIK